MKILIIMFALILISCEPHEPETLEQCIEKCEEICPPNTICYKVTKIEYKKCVDDCFDMDGVTNE